jgi:hypothetical protein
LEQGACEEASRESLEKGYSVFCKEACEVKEDYEQKTALHAWLAGNKRGLDEFVF